MGFRVYTLFIIYPPTPSPGIRSRNNYTLSKRYNYVVPLAVFETFFQVTKLICTQLTYNEFISGGILLYVDLTVIPNAIW